MQETVLLSVTNSSSVNYLNGRSALLTDLFEYRYFAAAKWNVLSEAA